MSKTLIITVSLIFNTLLFSQGNLIIPSDPLEALSEYQLDDCTMNDRSITFFLPVKNIDEVAWRKSLIQFVSQSKLESIDVNVIFFKRNQGKNSGVKVIDNSKKNIFSTFTITCLASGYDTKNLDRIKSKTSNFYEINTIDTLNNVSLVTVTDFLECPPNFKDKTKETMAKEELEKYKSFLTELYFPKYTTEEKFNQLFSRIKLLEDSNDEKDRKIKQLETEISELKNSITNSSSKDANEKQVQKELPKQAENKKKKKKK